MPTMSNIREVLEQRPLGLVFDIDGTLSPIVPTPDEARLHPGVAPLLEQARKYAQVAMVTGRSLDDGAAMVNIEGITYIGNHGVEWCEGLPPEHPIRIAPEALPYTEAGKYVLDLAEAKLTGIPGIIVQRKRIGGTIHYRNCPDPVAARQQILTLLAEPAHKVNMRLIEGKSVVEVRIPLAIDKGKALRQFSQQSNLHGVIFAGDDRTDLDAILEIDRQRHMGIAALAIVVQHHDTLPELLEHADILVQEVDGMVTLLREIVQILSISTNG